MANRITAFSRTANTLWIAVLLALLLDIAPCRHLAWAGVPLSSDILNSGGTLIADVAEKRINAVVNISSTKVIKAQSNQLAHPFFNDPLFRNFFGQRYYSIPQERRERSLGSGVIVSKDGLVLTNNHVVENATEIMVTLSNKQEFEAEIVGTDPKSDVAVIRLKGDLTDLDPIPFGNSGELRLGAIVLAIGNPFGLDHTVTMGIVSAKGRANVGITDYEDFIQTDAAINPGNSGGALINLKGELVGINTAIISKSGGYQGIGFAIPSNMAKAVMQSLVKHGKVVRGWLGVSIQDLDKKLAEAMGLKDTSGVLISNITQDGPAAKGKLKRGDVILKVNDEKMTSSSRLRNTIAAMGAGAEVELSIMRNGKKKTISLSLGELPDDFSGQTTLEEADGILGGMTVAPLNDLTREKFEISKKVKSGIAITKVEGGSSAERANLRPGDVILEVNRQGLDSVADFKKAFKKSSDNLLLLIYRQNHTFYLVVRK